MSSFDQALYGYEDGHRLIASSMQIPAETGRLLRSLTDMSFDGRADSHLTCLPLEEIDRYALIRSWPAPEVSRPGAVWSHVILLDFVDIGSLEHLGSLNRLFQRPRGKVTEWPGGLYEKQENLPKSTGGGLTALKETGVEQRLRVLETAYGKRHGVLQVDDIASLEPLLFELWSQQWPRLRRAFSFRTRYRAGESSTDFDLQLVERLHRDQQEASENLNLSRWMERLDQDLVRPTRPFRAFLRQFGAESEKGKGDLAALVELTLELEQRANPVELSRSLCTGFPRRKEMGGLKSALFGRPGPGKPLGPTHELDRLEGILVARPPTALNLKVLEFQERLEDLWSLQRTEAVRLLRELEGWEPSNKAALSSLMEISIANLNAGDLTTLAESNVQLALAIASKRRDLLQAPSLWRRETLVDGLLEMSARLDSEERCELLISLLKNNVAKAGEVLAQEPALWWPALSWGGRSIANGRSISRTSKTLGRALKTVGPGGVGAPPSKLSLEERALLAIVASPSAGLWRQVGADEWSEAADLMVTTGVDPPRSRGLVVLIAASGLPAEPVVRRDLWLAAFLPLHEAIEAEAVSKSDLDALSDILPKADRDWDERLRRGLVKEIKRDRWEASQVEQVLRLPRSQREELLTALKPKKKRRHWLREIVDLVSP